MPRDDNPIIEPEDTNTPPAVNGDLAADAGLSANTPSIDPNDEIPVPVAMEPAEIDERAKVVEALRERAPRVRDDDSEMRP